MRTTLSLSPVGCFVDTQRQFGDNLHYFGAWEKSEPTQNEPGTTWNPRIKKSLSNVNIL